MTQTEALKLALEAFNCLESYEATEGRIPEAITAIKEALVQPEQEKCENCGEFGECCQAQPEQEPMAWISTSLARMIHWTTDKPAYGDGWVPLYTTPPQRKPLTDEEIANAANLVRWSQQYHVDFARAIEAAHGIKE